MSAVPWLREKGTYGVCVFRFFYRSSYHGNSSKSSFCRSLFFDGGKNVFFFMLFWFGVFRSMLVVIECSSFQGRWTLGALRLGTEGILGYGANINVQRRFLSFGRKNDVIARGLGLFCAGALVASFRVFARSEVCVCPDRPVSVINLFSSIYVWHFFVFSCVCIFSVHGERRRCPVPGRLLLGTAKVFHCFHDF